MDIPRSAATIKTFFASRSMGPKKHLGQNFLIDPNIISRMVQAASLTPQDTVVEIGPGLGILTAELLQSQARVIAIEKDSSLIPPLQEMLPAAEIIEGDVLKWRLPDLSSYKVVANLPYYLTAPAIRKFLEADQQPSLMILMTQLEIADRICATPPDMNLLAASVQVYATPRIVARVSAASFWPKPHVDSAILSLIPLHNKDAETQSYFRVMKAGFSHPRKQIAGNLSGSFHISKQEAALWISSCGLNPLARAETISVESWIRLAKSRIMKE